jgi:hypothetical protein
MIPVAPPCALELATDDPVFAGHRPGQSQLETRRSVPHKLLHRSRVTVLVVPAR